MDSTTFPWKELVPLAQTLIWAFIIIALAVYIRAELKEAVKAFNRRVLQGGSVKLFSVLELGELAGLKDVTELESGPASRVPVQATQELSEFRTAVYEASRRIFIVHVIQPIPDKPGWMDVFIYLAAGKGGDVGDVQSADFYFGRHWGNRVFKVKPEAGVVGIRTSAYGPFLCVCEVKFNDGSSTRLSRFIDFEMQRTFEKTRKVA